MGLLPIREVYTTTTVISLCMHLNLGLIEGSKVRNMNFMVICLRHSYATTLIAVTVNCQKSLSVQVFRFVRSRSNHYKKEGNRSSL